MWPLFVLQLVVTVLLSRRRLGAPGIQNCLESDVASHSMVPEGCFSLIMSSLFSLCAFMEFNYHSKEDYKNNIHFVFIYYIARQVIHKQLVYFTKINICAALAIRMIRMINSFIKRHTVLLAYTR